MMMVDMMMGVRDIAALRQRLLELRSQCAADAGTFMEALDEKIEQHVSLKLTADGAATCPRRGAPQVARPFWQHPAARCCAGTSRRRPCRGSPRPAGASRDTTRCRRCSAPHGQ
ncbi:unnamed protein product, partial [Prorocentrum cordatum]